MRDPLPEYVGGILDSNAKGLSCIVHLNGFCIFVDFWQEILH